jgi:hypothetical protein
MSWLAVTFTTQEINSLRQYEKYGLFLRSSVFIIFLSPPPPLFPSFVGLFFIIADGT